MIDKLDPEPAELIVNNYPLGPKKFMEGHCLYTGPASGVGGGYDGGVGGGLYSVNRESNGFEACSFTL